MKILVFGSAILGVGDEIADLGTEFCTHDTAYSKHLFPGAQIVEAVLPADFRLTQFEYADGIVRRKPGTPEEIAPARAAVKAEITKRRYEIETAGIVVGGASIKTDRESQAMISGAVAYSNLAPDQIIDWKASSGWTQIDRTALLGIAQAVGAHVQGCFAVERAHHEAADGVATLADLAAIDITAGWPV